MTDDTRYVAVMVVEDDTEAFKRSLIDVAERHEVSDWSVDKAQYVKGDALRELIKEWREYKDNCGHGTAKGAAYYRCINELEALIDE